MIAIRKATILLDYLALFLSFRYVNALRSCSRSGFVFELYDSVATEILCTALKVPEAGLAAGSLNQNPLFFSYLVASFM
jgi:hypothetical protein